MPKYVIEYEIPGIGKQDADVLNKVAEHTCPKPGDHETGVYWLRSRVTDNKLHCTFLAPNDEVVNDFALNKTCQKKCAVLQNGGEGGCDRITRIPDKVDPSTAE